MRVAAVLPAGPPPMTTTSVVMVLAGDVMRSSWWWRQFGIWDTVQVSMPVPCGRFMRRAGGAQQRHQIAQGLRGQVAQLPRVAFADRLLQLAQECDTRVGDADTDDAAVVGGPVAIDQ